MHAVHNATGFYLTVVFAVDCVDQERLTIWLLHEAQPCLIE
jgi:hypothetical protein